MWHVCRSIKVPAVRLKIFREEGAFHSTKRSRFQKKNENISQKNSVFKTSSKTLIQEIFFEFVWIRARLSFNENLSIHFIPHNFTKDTPLQRTYFEKMLRIPPSKPTSQNQYFLHLWVLQKYSDLWMIFFNLWVIFLICGSYFDFLLYFLVFLYCKYRF